MACSSSWAGRSNRLGGRIISLPRHEVPAPSQNAPGDAGQLIGQRNREHVAVQSLSGCLDPGLEPVALPALGIAQHNPRRLNEQDAQVAIATLRYLAEDCAVPGRDLSRDQPEPCGKVAAFGEGLA